jgi:hypothetical protein
MNDWIDLHALWQIVVVGLLAGAGLPAVFAIGVRALAMPGSGGGARVQTADDSTEQAYGGNPAGLAIAVVCFAIVLAAIGYGIYLIVAGT